MASLQFNRPRLAMGRGYVWTPDVPTEDPPAGMAGWSAPAIRNSISSITTGPISTPPWRQPHDQGAEQGRISFRPHERYGDLARRSRRRGGLIWGWAM